MPVQILDKNDKIKWLESNDGGDVITVKYYSKEGLSQKVDEDTFFLYYDEDNPIETLNNLKDFKDLQGGSYDSWDDVTDNIQSILDGVTSTNGLSVSANTTLSSSNMSSTSINVVYVTTSSTITLTLDSTLGVGTIINVKDISGTAATNNTTVSGSAQTIDGSTSLTLNTNYSSYTIVKKSATEWYIISGLV